MGLPKGAAPSARNGEDDMNTPTRSTARYLFAAALVAAATLTLASVTIGSEGASSGPIEFTDARAQGAEFMEHYYNIELTPEQDAIKRAALEPLPAPCCSDNSAYTCCCPCNLSKTIWGLSALLITEHGADAQTVQNQVKDWIAYVNPNGYSGNVCTRAGGCPKPFAEDGCGGMRGSINWGD